MNWKKLTQTGTTMTIKSTSLWGRELKASGISCFVKISLVDLLVRSWIESAGRELMKRYEKVDLLVRSWIERVLCETFLLITGSTSLWGRELKGFKNLWAVIFHKVDLLVRSWIERYRLKHWRLKVLVDLLVRSWIERYAISLETGAAVVDLLVRSWIERT